MVSVRSRALRTSSALHPWASRSRITSACIGGSSAMARPMTSRVSFPRSRSSGYPDQSSGSVDQWPRESVSGVSKRSGSTAGAPRSVPASEANGRLLPSRCPRVLAMLVRIRKIHVRSDDRPSKLSRPRSTPSQVSWTTSSATARLETNMRATRSMAGWSWSTNIMKAVSSPARSRSASARSAGWAVDAVDAVTLGEPSARLSKRSA